MIARRAWLVGFGMALLASSAARASAEEDAEPVAPAPTAAAESWPKALSEAGVEFIVYQPQPSSWDGYRLRATAAVAAREKGQESSVYGAIELEGTTLVNKDERRVRLEQLAVTQAKFPSVADSGARYAKLLNAAARRSDAAIRTIDLDRLEGSLDTDKAKRQAVGQLASDPPAIVFASSPTLLILIDGAPVWRAVPKTSLERVVNTRPLLLRTGAGTAYLKVFDGWLEASALDSSWTATLHPPAELDAALKQALEAKTVDPLVGTDPRDEKAKPPSLAVNAPRILVATRPTELIVTQGAASYSAIAGTRLLYVENTTGHVFRHTEDQQLYVLIAGRWFRAASERGPWTFVAADTLPADFQRIPDDSPKENVKASVAGTPQAQEAVIACSIPQTAQIDRKVTISPKIDGEPRFEAIEGTSLARVVNCATPIIRVGEKQFYAVENGVWFSAAQVSGPWAVATSVPAVIYGILPASPVHHVTYVHVYDATTTVVVAGYTPGYYGTYVSGPTVVYGTGYSYPPWIGGAWYGPPVTYGFGVGIAYTPWTGWAFSFGFGWSWGHATMTFGGWGWGPYPWWGPVGAGFYGPAYYPWHYRPGGGAAWGARPGSGAVWGPGGWAASTGNVYHRWGAKTARTHASAGYDAWTGTGWSREVGRSYNSRTGTLSAGQRSSVGNIYRGDYRTSASGARVSTKTGGAVAAGSVTRGNVHAGAQVTAGAAVRRDPRTGEITTAAGVRGDEGGAARIGDDLYVSHEGQVARRDEDGNWQTLGERGEWKEVERGGRDATDLDRARQSRDQGSQRARGFASGAHRAAGFGGGRRR